ncbi:MAG: YbhB/YbcL family Raf kinase inhibitor-like protein [Methanospirillum sp.]|uniref:YbhB/YbcL family Raf kinase inhibitor-like protein n=1 Tax=Methanospirillum sp. TaxID=45200 RepID=UPI00236A0DE8|nr:YbhB/YbcL family Raf kinase inhibitor-like protein [Methanospirillum sp.]MDD1727788.1 YbhB/YbcL family Raf kinase inhibitor-like protein [Methanospirillum sp.]
MNLYQSLLVLTCILAILVSGCLQASESSGNQPGAAVDSNHSLKVSVNSAINGSTLPTRYTCMGPGQVPSIFWKDAPSAARSMVLIMDDPDASDRVYTHWIVYNLSPESEAIPPNQMPVSERAGSGYQGINSMGTRGYTPACPPSGTPHRYIFTLYALDTNISPDPPDRSHIDAAMEGHVLAQARIVTFLGQ